MSLHTSYRNIGNDRQRSNVLMFKQILLTKTMRNIWKMVQKVCMLIQIDRHTDRQTEIDRHIDRQTDTDKQTEMNDGSEN